MSGENMEGKESCLLLTFQSLDHIMVDQETLWFGMHSRMIYTLKTEEMINMLSVTMKSQKVEYH